MRIFSGISTRLRERYEGGGGNSSPLDSDRSSFSSSSLLIRLEDLFALDKCSRLSANLPRNGTNANKSDDYDRKVIIVALRIL